MGAKYCAKSGCGAKTEYSIKVPAFCSACGQPFATTFGAAKPVSISTPVGPSVTPRYTSATPRHQRPLPDGQEESDRYDKDEVHEMARELAASMASDVELVVVGGDKGVSLKDMLDPTKNISVGNRGPVQIELPPQ